MVPFDYDQEFTKWKICRPKVEYSLTQKKLSTQHMSIGSSKGNQRNKGAIDGIAAVRL